MWHGAIPPRVAAYSRVAGRAGRDGLPARAVLLAGRSDLSRLVHFIQRREIDPGRVGEYLDSLRSAADADGALVIDNPRNETDRIRLAIAERAGACSVDPSSGGRLEISVRGPLDPARAERECRVARDRGWRAYRAVKAFASSGACRRRMLLDHFGDDSLTAPLGRCCDVCDPETGLPDPDTLPVRGRGRSGAKPAAPVDLAAADAPLFERLRAWRSGAAAGKPAYTVAHDTTLRAIATARPSSPEALVEIRGIGPAFITRHAQDVLEIVATERQAA